MHLRFLFGAGDASLVATRARPSSHERVHMTTQTQIARPRAGDPFPRETAPLALWQSRPGWLSWWAGWLIDAVSDNVAKGVPTWELPPVRRRRRRLQCWGSVK